MKLHLGEGADEYRDLIERAIEVWNETVKLPSREPLIEIVDERWPPSAAVTRTPTVRARRRAWPLCPHVS